MPVEEPTPPPPIIPGVARALSPLLRRIAHEGPDGEPGLNTYLIGIDEIVIVDPGPGVGDHLDVVCGCGGDRIRWIVMTEITEEIAGGALKLKEMTGAELVAPAGFDGADEILGDGYKIDATEFQVTALNLGADSHIFVLHQERCIISGDLLAGPVPDGLKSRVAPYRIKSIAPGHGQLNEEGKAYLAGSK